MKKLTGMDLLKKAFQKKNKGVTSVAKVMSKKHSKKYKADNEFMTNDTEKMAYKKHKKMTQAQDDAADKKAGRKEGSKADIAQDKRDGIKDNPKQKKHSKHCKCKACA